jgi:CRISPR/Cas system CSM-associated protein Csm3 (group 7 of RAMP superfamily)
MSDLNRANLRSRYHVIGRLVMDTALHIGGGREASTITDSPVVRDVTGEPFIPGSSLKGAFRAAVERLVPLLGLRTCQLADSYADCLSTNRDLSEQYQVIRGQLGRELRDDNDTRQAIRALRQTIDRLNPASPSLAALGWPNWAGQTISERHLLALLDVLLCETCKTFGSVHLVSAAFFHDLPVDGTWYDTFQIRDGVGIDRDSERAKEQIKFDFEVVPPQTAFTFGLTLENPSDRDLGLVAIGLQEFTQGMVPIGGIRSRGLGRCHLADLKVAWVDFSDERARKDYLVTGKMSEEAGPAFIARHVAALVGA